MAQTDKSRLQRTRRRLTDVAVGLLLICFSVLFFFPRMMFTIYPGEGGVIWDRFLGNHFYTYGDGFHIVAPWTIVYRYDIRLQMMTNDYDALAQTGLPVKVTLSVRFKPADLGELHRRIGPDYREKVVVPLVDAALRQVVGRHSAEDLYRLERKVTQQEIFSVIAERRGNPQFGPLESTVDIVDVLVRNITLPEGIRQAIERKMAEEQAMLTYEYTVQKEKREAERKTIEAGGIRQFQEVVTQGITPSLLQWKGIEATLELARSANSKVVIIGGKDGLPLILNMSKGK